MFLIDFIPIQQIKLPGELDVTLCWDLRHKAVPIGVSCQRDATGPRPMYYSAAQGDYWASCTWNNVPYYFACWVQVTGLTGWQMFCGVIRRNASQKDQKWGALINRGMCLSVYNDLSSRTSSSCTF